MAKYTTELRTYCESLAGYTEEQGYDKVDEIINATWDKVFDFPFDMFDEDYKPILCKKIILHYYTREIGLETVGLFKLKLMSRIRDIMPKYNELYRTALAKYDFLTDADYSIEHSGEDARNSTTDYTSSIEGSRGVARQDENTHMFSDTPQGSLVNVNNGTYLTNASKDNGSGSSSENYDEGRGSNEYINSNGTDYYINKIKGKFPGKTYATLIKEFRDNIINVDEMIIRELRDLFMLVW